MAQTYHIDVDAGSDFSLEVLYTNPDGTAIALTNGAAELVIREKIPGAPALLTLSNGDGITITAGIGKLLIQMTRAQTADLEGGRFVYDLHYTSAGDERVRLMEGAVNVNPLL